MTRNKEFDRYGVDEDTGIDFDARYTVAGMRGVAFYLVGYETEHTEETFTVTCEDDGHDRYDHDDPDSDQYSGQDGEVCGYTTESEEIERKDMVRAIMVGDDTVHTVDVGDLTVIEDDEDGNPGYCRECGQTGCTADGR
jgi:hypothetical protein